MVNLCSNFCYSPFIYKHRNEEVIIIIIFDKLMTYVYFGAVDLAFWHVPQSAESINKRKAALSNWAINELITCLLSHLASKDYCFVQLGSDPPF